MRHVLTSVLLGAAAGVLAVVVTGLAIAAELIPMTLPAGVAGGMTMGLVASRIRARGATRFMSIAAAGFPAVFVTQLLVMRILGIEEMGSGSSVLAATVTAVVALPGILVGTVALHMLVRRDLDAEARVLGLDDAFASEAPIAEAAARKALQDESIRIREIAIRWLARTHPDPIPMFREHLDRTEDHEMVARELVVPLADGIRRIDGAEDLLLRILEEGGWDAHRASVHSLAFLGSERSLEALERFVARDYFAAEARAAMRRIRERQPNAGAGLLSEVPANDASGRLSTPVKPGTLSKPS